MVVVVEGANAPIKEMVVYNVYECMSVNAMGILKDGLPPHCPSQLWPLG